MSSIQKFYEHIQNIEGDKVTIKAPPEHKQPVTDVYMDAEAAEWAAISMQGESFSQHFENKYKNQVIRIK